MKPILSLYIMVIFFLSGCQLKSEAVDDGVVEPNAGYGANTGAVDDGDLGVIRPVTDGAHGLVKVLFATNRKQLDSERCTEAYSGRRGSFGDTKYGYCMVSIPVGHEVGVVEEKRWYQLKEDPDKHVVLLGGQSISKQEFDKILNLGLANKSNSTLLFVHGYNVSFADAAKRTAQMAYDLNFSGVPLFFSWPANGNVLSYAADEASVEWSEPALYNFLVDHLSNPKIKQTFLIAHSMGNRAVLSSLARLKLEHPDLRYKLKEVVLAAPDVDAEQFVDIIVPKIADPNIPVTLYASSRDKALLTSKRLHYYERAGDIPEPIRAYAGVEFIDASAVKTDFLNHSYVSQSRSVLSDILDLFGGSRPANRSGLRAKEAQGGQYWEVK
ncbi:alpha/beta hydrolase [Pseudomonas corrugata]|uniref:Alpha/beta hydrolase n=1 Tax=Pseudomonas corrugata TaxID=47879 RepID=A0A7Y5Z3Q5_9PSED|nr:alpha/beta hydrolase [Pseudomonas corrugata]NUT86448.1 alpha/beta hydrolase [Pseudomonas corrugata]